ncbi:hypothetical protein ABPG75_001989 [Micractinium tetrahymenae]
MSEKRMKQIAAALLLLFSGIVAATSSNAGCGDYLGSAADLPVVKSGGECGAGLARCPKRQCCSPFGRCEDSCTTACQCEFSGKRSECPGSMLLSTGPDDQVPVAPAAGVCGQGVATCPQGQCCTVFGFCPNNCTAPDPPAAAHLLAAPKPRTRRYKLVVAWKTGAPDGFRRRLIAINGRMPGPTLRCTVGDRLIIRVHNKLDAPMMLPWHGILQRGTGIMDGVPGVTQRALQPRSSQLYDFICPPPGTFWYHSHFKEQYIDGMKGALIIRDPALPRFPAESIVQLSDWYHVEASKLMKEYLSPASGGNEPVPISALINGVGQANCTGEGCRYAVIPARPGSCKHPSTILRLINTAGFAQFLFSVDGHRLIVVSLDGLTMQPSQPLRGVVLNAGQRVGVLVCPDGPRRRLADWGPAWVRAHMIQSVFATDSPDPTVLGILQYGKRTARPRRLPDTQPAKFQQSEVMGDTKAGGADPYLLQPLSRQQPPEPAQEMQLLPAAGGSPGVPSILETLLANHSLPASKDFGYHIEQLQAGAIVQVVINNHDTGEHPLHLHGHWFWVMGRGRPNVGDYDPTKDQLKEWPLLRDTATVPAGSWMVLRFAAANPGVWIFHCHIDWHLGAGLALVFAYDPAWNAAWPGGPSSQNS